MTEPTSQVVAYEELVAGEEVLLLQVPKLVMQDDGVPMKTVFLPFDDSDLTVSTLRGYVGAQEAHRRWTEDLGYQSEGTWGVSVDEIRGHGLRAIDDSSSPSNPEDHASIDYSSMSEESQGARIRVARKLRSDAAARGRLYP